MAITDALTGTIKAEIVTDLTRTGGNVSGKDTLSHSKSTTLADGSSAGQASGHCGTTIAVTTGSNTISLADSADPFGALGDDVPNEDPEGLKLRAIMIENLDSTNYVTLGLGTNAVTSWLAGTTPTVRILAGSVFYQTFNAGGDALNDGADDEITLQANTATCNVKISYVFG